MNLLKLNFANIFADAVGQKNGLTEKRLQDFLAKNAALRSVTYSQARKGKYQFMELPFQGGIEEIIEFAEQRRERYRNFIVLGIGGSSLGARALWNALALPYSNLKSDTVRFFFPDNIDPQQMSALLSLLDPRQTLCAVITKSGSTAETAANFLVFLKWLKNALGESWRKNLVFVTDPERGDLRTLSRQESITTFDVPRAVEGRFAVLSPVGLLPAAFAGIDIKKLLDGAGAYAAVCENLAPDRDPAFVAAAVNYLLDTEKGKNITVFIPYSHSLRYFADWFAQLWGESLGKRINTAGKIVHTGPTPVKALGVTDQHSQAQLYTEGPNNKLITILKVEAFGADVEIPPLLQDLAAFSYLGGKQLSQLMLAECDATALALTEASRPNYTIALPRISEDVLGALIYLLELQTLFAGSFYEINPFNQPGVEAGKRATYALIGRDGYKDKRAEIEAAIARAATNQWVL